MDILKGAHTRYKIRYHIVWGVKYSRKLLFGERIRYLKEVLEEIAVKYDYIVEAVGTDEDHLHVFAGAPPAVSPAQLVQVLKSISARRMFEKYPEIKKFLWGGAFWAIGYYIRTVSDGPIEKVIQNYVRKQEEKRRKAAKAKKGKAYKPYQLKLVP